MRHAAAELAGLLLVQILRQILTHLRVWTARVDTTQKDREVPHVHVELLLEVQQELLSGGAAIVEVRPGPVVLPVHDRQEILLEQLLFGDGEGHHGSFRTRASLTIGPWIMMPGRPEIKRSRPSRRGLREGPPAAARAAAPAASPGVRRGPGRPRGSPRPQGLEPPGRRARPSRRRSRPPRPSPRGPAEE